MRKLPQQTIYKVTTPLLVVIILLLLLLLIIPFRTKILSLNENTLEARADLEKQYLSGQLLKKTQSQFDLIQPRLPELEAATLKRGQELYLITTLETIANKYDLIQKINLNDLQFTGDAEEIEVFTLPVSVDLTGNFDQVLGYLQEIESLEFYLNWKSINIKSMASPDASRQTSIFPGQAPTAAPPTGDFNASVRATMSGETYWQIQ